MFKLNLKNLFIKIINFFKINLDISYIKILKILLYLIIQYKILIIKTIKNTKKLLKNIQFLYNKFKVFYIKNKKT